MHSLFKTSKLAGSLFALLILFLWSGSFARDFNKYAGTHKGKIDFSGDYPVTSEYNEIPFTISDKGNINIFSKP
jgi:type 1 fimbria pilin